MRGRLRQRKNPLRRGSDRIQWWLSALALLLAVAGLPAALAVGLAVDHDQARAARAEAASRHPVTARVAENVPVGAGTATVPATVTWTSADGTAHRGIARVVPGERAGAEVRIWLDAAGTVVRPPATTGQAAVTGWIAGLLTATALPLVGVLVRDGGRVVLDRRRYARWDAEWLLVEPHWTRRQPS
ncbi:Rv1733c family protein [Kitasatospora cheerisanensis]|uniref:Uncharacterized protein n=1 Tax=Kitasatospora cheerisanensis KCTC 2395 TaxID=1348663 RepID=A0A066YS94_9ACTN|nr:hypothetical protein [Kitasatospora cheerisanensis]KDN80780.1 hypothetical protein KCH_74150 [Kitasatospora cheerisanensis KCTC 2395]